MQRRGLPVAPHEDPAMLAVLTAKANDQPALLSQLGLEPAVVLVLDNACESQCFFCANPGTRDVPAERQTSWQSITQHMSGRPADVERLLVGGNDPVLHPDFGRLLVAAADAGFRQIEVMTSGISLGDAPLDVWRRLGVETLTVPIYSVDAATHDAICGVACFDKLARGLELAARAGIKIEVHTVVMRRTLPGLVALAAWVESRFGGSLALAPLREKADVFRYDDEAVPLPELEALLASLPPHAPVSLLGLPRCLAPERARGGAAIMQIYFSTQRRGYAKVCADCSLRAACPGIVAGELARRGDTGLRPSLAVVGLAGP
jgi:pyruvate-formate lyase-activating enzyme